MKLLRRRLLAGSVLLSFLSIGLVAPLDARQPTQVAAKAIQPDAVQKRPWLYENSDVPIDTAWLFGTLPNGLRYAVRRNGVPPGQVSIRLRIDAGSLMERDDELGFAHFMEHLTFRGSRHVPDGESKRIWQRLGVSFGSDSNAQTTPTGTTYALDLPEAGNESIDASLKILAGMMAEPNIVPTAVDAERAIVQAEMRESTSVASKAADATRAFLFAGQLLGARSPIGAVASLNTATADSMQAFHDRWYRPENAVISVSGDIDPALIEAAIKRNFVNWKGGGAPVPLPDFGRPDPKAPASAVTIQPGVPVSLSLAWLRPWKPKADTIVYNQAKLTDMVALQIVNRRLEDAAREGRVDFLAASAEVQDVSRSADGTFLSITPNGAGWEKALEQVRAIIEDARTTAPTEQEIAREYAQFDTALAISVENQDTEPGSKQASDLVSAVDIRETIVSPQAALDIFRAAKAGMTPERMREAIARMFSGDARRAMLVLPEAQPDAEARLSQALARPVMAAVRERRSVAPTTIDQLPKLGPAGYVTGQQLIATLGAEIINFSNGAKLMLFANDAETGKVRINVRFGGGLKALSAKRNQPSWAAGYVLASNGIGSLSQSDVDEIMNGRRLGMEFGIDDDAFEFSALTRPADYKDQLRLLAAKLAAPGWDPSPVERVKAGLLAAYDSSSTSAGNVLAREAQWLLRGHDARFHAPGKAEIEALTPQSFRALWEPLLASGPIEVQVFGDVKRDEAIAAVAETIGALPMRKALQQAPSSSRLLFARHNREPVILRHSGDADQAAAMIAWPTASGLANAREARQLDVLAQIISDRLFEKLRSVDGAAYSPNASANFPLSFDHSQGYLLVSSQLKPERVGYFYGMVNGIARDLAARPVSDDELQRVLEPMRQMLIRASTGNAFWMSLLEGGTVDQRYINVTQSIGHDLLDVTAADLQALAARTLVPNKSYSVAVLPHQTKAELEQTNRKQP